MIGRLLPPLQPERAFGHRLRIRPTLAHRLQSIREVVDAANRLWSLASPSVLIEGHTS
jgi:hypothetical protein